MDPVAIPVVAMLIPIVVVPTAMVLKQQRRKREYEHQERMKALEMGHLLPVGHAWSAFAVTAIGAGVPIGAFLFAWLASLTNHAADEVWPVAGVVGLAGVGGGVYLAKRVLGFRDNRPAPREVAFGNGKPAFDPDAYDVAGRRG